MPKPNVLLTGSYSTWNKGDAAMQLVVGGWCRDNLDSEVTIASVHSDHDRDFYTKHGFQTVSTARRSFWPLVRQICAASALAALPDPLRRRFSSPKKELGAIIRSSLVVDLSGDMLTEAHGIRLALSHFGPLLACRLLRKRYFVCAQSIGPFSLVKPIAKFVLRGAEKVTTREALSSRLLEEYNVPFTEYSDTAFLLEPSEPAANPTSFPIGVNLSSLCETHFRDHTGQSLVHLVATVLNEIGKPVLLIPHVTGPRQEHDDRLILLELASRLTCDYQLFDDDVAPSEIKAVIGSTEIFIGARMHACIAALSQGVPTLVFSYSHKSLGVMKKLDQEEFVITPRNFDKDLVKQLVDHLISNNAVQRRIILSTLEGVRESALTNLETIKSLSEFELS